MKEKKFKILKYKKIWHFEFWFLTLLLTMCGATNMAKQKKLRHFSVSLDMSVFLFFISYYLCFALMHLEIERFTRLNTL